MPHRDAPIAPDQPRQPGGPRDDGAAAGGLPGVHDGPGTIGASADELLEHGGGLVEMDRNWVIVRVNAAQERATGKARSETLGRRFWDVWPEAVETRTWHEYHRCMEERVPVEFEAHFEPLDTWFDVSAHPTSTGGIAVFFRDVGVRKRAGTDQARLASIVQNTPDAIISKNLDGVIETWNAGAERLFGYAAHEAIGRPIAMLLPPERLEEEDRLLALLRAGRRVAPYETTRVRKDGSLVEVIVTVSPLRDDAGEIVGASKIAHDITARKRSERALRDSEAKFRSVFEQAAVGIGRVRFSDARWIDVNDAFCRMLGRSRAELLRTPWPEITHPADLDLDLVPFRRMAAGELDWYTAEKRFRHADGHHVWAKLTLSLVRDADGRPDYEVAIIEDVDDRKRAEQAARESRARIDAALASATDAVFVSDADGRFVEFNDAFVTFHRFPSRARCEARLAEYPRLFEVLFPDGTPAPPEAWAISRAMRGERVTAAEFILVRRETGERWSGSFSSAPIHDGAGAIVGTVTVARDITEQKRFEAALVRANEQLQDADRRKDEFLGMLSHELRNPLAPIRNSLYIMDHAEPTGQQARRAKEVIDRQVAHLTRLVDDLLDVTRIARGKIELRRADLDLGALARRTADDYRALMHDRGLDLALQVPDHPLVVNGDETRLAQVLGNLLSNAAKFTPPGGRVSIGVRSGERRAAVCVHDTGPGIAPEVLPTIFEPFIQGKQTLARSEGGLGLGLALVKGLVALHGGDVAVHSPGGGRGTEFVVTLPLAAARRSDAHGAARDAAPRARRRRVLVIDDNRDAAESLAQLISMLGHEADVAYDALSALGRASEELPDVILCDIGLPGMDGYEFARQLRALAGERAVRLVAVSGYAQPEDVARSAEAGFDDHVAKPPDLRRIERLLA